MLYKFFKKGIFNLPAFQVFICDFDLYFTVCFGNCFLILRMLSVKYIVRTMIVFLPYFRMHRCLLTFDCLLAAWIS